MKRRSGDTETRMGQPQGEWGKGNFEKVTLCHFANTCSSDLRGMHMKNKKLEIVSHWTCSKTKEREKSYKSH